MLYIVYGTDREKQRLYIEKVKKSHPDYRMFSIERSGFSKEMLEQTIFGEALFSENYLVVLDGVTELVEYREYIEGIAEELETSKNIVLIQDTKLPADFIKKIVVHAEEVIEYKKDTARPDFSLWNYFYARDKRSAWEVYLTASRTEASEKIHAGLLGQVRSMHKVKIADKGAGWKELGFSKDTSYNQALKASEKFTESELKDMLYELTRMFGMAHEGAVDFKLELEAFLLKYL